ncbi:hypothetical protein Ocin01_08984, partial [Orchesella cincta]
MHRDDFEEVDPAVEGVQSYLEMVEARGKMQVKVKPRPVPFEEGAEFKLELNEEQPRSSVVTVEGPSQTITTTIEGDITGVTKMLDKMSMEDFEGLLAKIQAGGKELTPQQEAELIYDEFKDELEQDHRAPKEMAKPRRKKQQKKVRETVIKSEDAPGYQGTENDVDKLLEFIEGNQTKTKITEKRKKTEVKPKKNQKQTLQKAVVASSTGTSVKPKTTAEGGSNARAPEVNPIPVLALNQKQTPQKAEVNVKPESETIIEVKKEGGETKPVNLAVNPSSSPASSKDSKFVDEVKQSVSQIASITKYEDLKSEKGYESDDSYVLASNRKKNRHQCESVSVRPSSSTYQPHQDDSSHAQRRYTDLSKFGGPSRESRGITVTKSYVKIVRNPKKEGAKPRSTSIDSAPVATSKERHSSTPSRLEALDLHFPPLVSPSVEAPPAPKKTKNAEKKLLLKTEESLRMTVKSLVQRVQTLEQNVQGLMQSNKHGMSQKGQVNPQEPVVFCGINFNSAQTLAGRNTGFEFGFGVMKTLKDKGVAENPTTSEMIKRWNVKAATFVPATRAKI